MGTGNDDLVVQRVDQVGYFWRGAGGDFLNCSDSVFLVARIDPLRAVASVKIHVKA